MEILSRFAAIHGITYPLLADVGSSVITDLGILNVTMDQERAAYGRPIEERHRGVPYPGTFFLDEDGVVAGKRFEQSHRIRPTTNTLLAQLADDHPVRPEIAAEAASPGVRVAAWLDSPALSANQLQNVNVRVAMDDGVHLYTDPVPDGFTALRAHLGGDDRLQVEPVEMPRGHPFTVTGLPERFQVVEGTFDVTIPFFLLSNRDTAGDPVRSVTLTVDLAYQACTDDECFMPEHITLELPLREEPNPGYESTDRGAVAPLVLRRIVEGPKSAAELLVLVNAALEGVEVAAADIDEVLAGLEQKGLVTPGDDGRWAESATT